MRSLVQRAGIAHCAVAHVGPYFQLLTQWCFGNRFASLDGVARNNKTFRGDRSDEKSRIYRPVGIAAESRERRSIAQYVLFSKPQKKGGSMKLLSKIAASVGPTLALATVSFAQQVKTDYDHNANFGQYKTFSWEKVRTKDPLLVDRIKSAV